jgi:hypothetical protein
LLATLPLFEIVENRKRGTTGLGAVLVKRQRKGEGKKISELGSNNGRIGHVINRANAGDQQVFCRS